MPPTTRAVPTPQPAEPPTRTPSLAPLPIDGPRVVNIVCGVTLNCPLDLKTLALHARNAVYNPKRFHAVILRQRDPRSSVLVFASGEMQILGTRSVPDARLAARKFARMVQKTGFAVRMTGFNVQNLVAHVNVRFEVRLEGIARRHAVYAQYEPEIFPGLIYRVLEPRVSMLILTTGKVICLGAKREEDLERAVRGVFPVLAQHRLVREG